MTRISASDLRSHRFWRQLATGWFAAIGVVAVLLGLWDVLLPDTVPRVGQQAAVLIAFGCLAAAVLRAWPRKVEQSYGSPNVTIRVIPGDLLAQTAHLVIGMSDTFDTAPGVIASTSLQAKFLAAVYDGDIDRLDRDLDDALRSVDAPPVGSIDKTGKTRRYPLGTVAPVLAGERRFFCVAYSAMNSRNEARATIDGLLASLSALWKSVCQHANGGVVAMPVIGMGQSRLSQALSPSDAIRLQIMSFWLASREERLCDGLTVVVRPEVYDALDRRELQAFLAGLRPS